MVRKPHGVGVLFLRDGLELAGADRLLLAHEADEALDVPAPQLLVRACQPGELAHVRVAGGGRPTGRGRRGRSRSATILSHSCSREAAGDRRQPLVPLKERTAEAQILCGQIAGQASLEGEEERPLRRPSAEEHERVVRDADERGREDGDESLVVIAVVEKAEVGEQVDHLLLAEVAAAGGTVGLEPRLAQLILVVLGVRPAPRRGTISPALASPESTKPSHGGRCAGPRRGASASGAGVARLVGDEQLDRGPENRIGKAPGGASGWNSDRTRSKKVVDRRKHLGPRAVVLRERKHAARLFAPLAEDLDVGVAKTVDGLELVPTKKSSFPSGPSASRSTISHCSLFVSWNSSTMIEREPPALAFPHHGLVPEQVARRAGRSSKSSADSRSFAAR